jgi:hypothetical protein
MKKLGRFGALTGAAYVVLILVGNTMSTEASPGPHPDHPTGQQNIDYLHWLAGSTVGQVGLTLELLGFAAWVLFVGYLCARVRAGGWLAAAALTGGIVSIAVKIGSAAPLFTAFLLRDEISPETARVLIDMNGAAFVTDWLPTGLFVACAAAAALACRAVGRILGWGGVAAGSITAITVVVAGVHAMTATFLPYLLCLLWLLAISARLTVQRTARPAPDAEPEPVSVPV